MMPALALLPHLLQFAPSLLRAFKGSDTSVEVAETAAALARKVTGSSTNEDALTVLASDPAKALEYQKEALNHAQALEQIYADDKDSARLRDVQFLKAGTRNYRADFLVGVSVLIVATILGVVILVDTMNEYAKGCLTTILGVFLNQLTNVFSFEFGATRKDDAKADQAFKQVIASGAPGTTKGE